MRMLSLLSLCLLLPVAFASHTPLGECDSASGVGVGEVTGGTWDTTYYVDDRGVAENGIWLYAESGGAWSPKPAGVYTGDVAEHDLQRGGASPYLPDDTETCVDDPNGMPDLRIL